MKPPKSPQKSAQLELFVQELDRMVNHAHPLIKLAQRMNWESFDAEFGALYCPDNGRPAINTRLMVSVHYLKYAFNLSDEDVIASWVENPYWQYFSGMIHFQHEFPMHRSSMSRWRKRLGEKGGELLLKETIESAIHLGALRRFDVAKVYVDTTVSEKNITFPTDGKLAQRSLERLVKEARKDGLILRQPYTFVAKQVLILSQRYAHSRKMKKASAQVKKLFTYLGRVIRDVERKAKGKMSQYLQQELALAKRLLTQKRHDRDKLYSLHEPHVYCISKGKAHKKYEFGSKVSLATTLKGNWVVASMGIEGNRYDGHTLAPTMKKVEELLNVSLKEVYVDRGYKGHGCSPDIVHIDKERRGKTPMSLWKKLKRRARIEPVIGHLKSQHRMERNYLGGELGDKLNAVLSGAGFNLRKLLKLLSSLLGTILTSVLRLILELLENLFPKQKDDLLLTLHFI